MILEKGDKIEILSEKIDWNNSMMSVQYSGKLGTYTVYGDVREGEVTDVMNEYGDNILDPQSIEGEVSEGDEPGLFNIIKTVNLLMSPRVDWVDVD